jgi:DNA-binding protein
MLSALFMDKSPRVIAIGPSDTSLKTSDVAEKIISGIMESGELDIIGVSDAMFLACSAINMTTEIANIFINETFIEPLEDSALGKVSAISAHLSQTENLDFKKLVEKEDKEMVEDQAVSVSRGISTDKLLTICLLKLSRYDKVKLMAAGGAINDAVSLALKVTTGKISKDTVGVNLVDIYSIVSREDKNRKITAISIYLKKGVTTENSKRHSDFLEKLKSA